MFETLAKRASPRWVEQNGQSMKSGSVDHSMRFMPTGMKLRCEQPNI